MKSFKNKLSGVILTPKNAWVEKQLELSKEFEEVKAKATKETSKGAKATKEASENENNE